MLHDHRAGIKKKYRLISAALIGIMIVSIILYFVIYQKCLLFGHKWQDADCVHAKTCSVCDKTEGDALGHSWIDATCLYPMTCTVCNQTQGGVIEHTWLEPTCENPAICVSCGDTSGDALGHDWIDATFTAPKTCSMCFATEGTALTYDSISVEDEVLEIREKYSTIVDGIQAGVYRKDTLHNGTVVYYNDAGERVCVIVYKGTDGIGEYSGMYSRTYYFSENKLFFAFYEGKDSHRLYFYEEQLMRWRYTAAGSSSAENHDFAFSDEYCMWERYALNEIEIGRAHV